MRLQKQTALNTDAEQINSVIIAMSSPSLRTQFKIKARKTLCHIISQRQNTFYQ